MNNAVKTYFIFLSLALVFSCNRTPQAAKTEASPNDYHQKELGWSATLPAGWEVVSKQESEDLMKKGREAIEKSGETAVDEEGLVHLLEFKKNTLNQFISTMQPYKEEFPGQYAQNCYEMGKVIYTTLQEQGLRLDSAYGEEEIGGLKFYTFYTTIYDQDGGVLLNQAVYSRLINGYDFSVNLNYDNAADKATLLKVWKESKFE